MKQVIVLLFCITGISAFGQVVSTNPGVPSPSQPVTITFDVTGTDFASKNLNDVWLWAWLEKGATDVNAPTNVNPATAAQDAAKVTRSSANPNLYSITITATSFFNKPAWEISTVGILLKGRDWTNGKTTDKFITFSETFNVAFTAPTAEVFFVNESESIEVSVNTNEDATITLKKAGAVIASSAGAVQQFDHTLVVTETGGSVVITAEANDGTTTKTASFTYVVRTPTVTQARPAGIIEGINYSGDLTSATLCLLAPGKSSVYVLGDFNGWQINPAFQMKKDGERFWLEIGALAPGTEYAFQYLVDEEIKVADPYADKILDPDDMHIPASSYPDLKAFPSEAMSDQWYFNRLAVLQTGQAPYAWEVTDFVKPEKEKLVIYELLVRDFFGQNERNYQNLIDTLGYLKRLGVNAIELMPIMEFNGNESWGYNPAFMFAPDKYYGTKNKLKEFVDTAHKNGMAVILDIAMNHQDLPNPFVMLDFDFVNGKPQADNRWFNVTATHPFSVFFDMNHESTYTQDYLDTVNHYWLNEYKADGFRFDLSKGFTQTSNPLDVNAWSAYDASRVALLKRMADRIWEHSPDAYVILEHLSVNNEEKELAEYRAEEGKGMLLWGKMTEQYNQLTMGYVTNTDISGVYHESRGWEAPHLVSYMESHDEERLMVKNMWYGNTSPNYTVRNESVSLARIRAASTLFYTLPGPKMLWQFGELGYDYSINYCPDGSISEGCRVSPKPVVWEYREETERERLYHHVSDLLRLRRAYDVFTDGSATMSSGNSLLQQILLKNEPYTATPVNAGEMNVVIAANFDLAEQDMAVAFPHTGTWYDYYRGGATLDVAAATRIVRLTAGDFKLYTDVPIESPVITSAERSLEKDIHIYPNPVGDKLVIVSGTASIQKVSFFSNFGSSMVLNRLDDSTWDVSYLPPGLFVAEVRTRSGMYRMKLMKK